LPEITSPKSTVLDGSKVQGTITLIKILNGQTVPFCTPFLTIFNILTAKLPKTPPKPFILPKGTIAQR